MSQLAAQPADSDSGALLALPSSWLLQLGAHAPERVPSELPNS